MKQSIILYAARLLLALYWIIIKSQVESYLDAFYITSIRLSHQYISTCYQFLNHYHNDSFNCFVMTLDELLDYEYPNGGYSPLNHRLVVFLPGTHVVTNSKQVKAWFANSSVYNETIIGLSNVTIMCRSRIRFLFSKFTHIKISKIHFKNCSSDDKDKSTLMFNKILSHTVDILLEELEITGENITGVNVAIGNGSRHNNKARIFFNFNLENSTISTGSTGMYVLDTIEGRSDESVKIIVNSVTFLNSCLNWQSVLGYQDRYNSMKYEIKHSGFIGSTCTSILSFGSHLDVSLDNVLVSGCQSQRVIKLYNSSTLNMKGHNYFYNNTGAIDIIESTLHIFEATVKFFNNSVVGNSILFAKDSFIKTTHSHIIFENNKGQSCGGISAMRTKVSLIDTTVDFIGNYGQTSGAIMLYSQSHLSFSCTKSKICYRRFYNNNGSAIVRASWNSKLSFCSTEVEFFYNAAYGIDKPSGRVLFANDSFLVFNDSQISFKNNTGLQCGGIMATMKSNVIFSNSVANFTGNTGGNGGAISLHSLSVLTLNGTELSTQLTFLRNRAQKGGAIYVDDKTYIENHRLLISSFQVIGSLAHLHFYGNTAVIGGNNVYGGWIDWFVHDQGIMTYNTGLSHYFKFVGEYSQGIASDPSRICMCQNNVPNCNVTNWKVNLYPGQSIKVELVAVGQRFGIVVAYVTAELENNDKNIQWQPARIREFQIIQTVQKTCTPLTYTVLSLKEKETLLITELRSTEFGLGFHQNKDTIFGSNLIKRYPDKLGLLFTQFKITRYLKSCPFSFELNKTGYSCICPPSLTLYSLGCDTAEYKILRSDKQWIGVTYDHSNNGSPSILAHRYCPFDYCKTDIKSLSIDLNHSNELCAFNRSGVLCGGCEQNLSRVLGSSKCKVCSNIMLIAIIPTSLLAGLFLILFLMILNLTVSVGTINGLIFYANIIQAQHATFFNSKSETSNSFSRNFIALLNLDQGFESCLYNGFDSYIETWLQLCFSLYIWS